MNDIVGDNLKKMRKSKGWSQETAADFVSLSQSAYARIENGESHSWACHINKICEVFEINPEDLFKQDKMVINNTQQEGINFAETINQLSEKLIAQYEFRLQEKDAIITELQARLKKVED